MVPQVRKILFATDLTEDSRHAFQYASSLAARYGATIVLFHVIEKLPAGMAQQLELVAGAGASESFRKARQQKVNEVLIGKREDFYAVNKALENFSRDAQLGDRHFHEVCEVVIVEGDAPEEIVSAAAAQGRLATPVRLSSRASWLSCVISSALVDIERHATSVSSRPSTRPSEPAASTPTRAMRSARCSMRAASAMCARRAASRSASAASMASNSVSAAAASARRSCACCGEAGRRGQSRASASRRAAASSARASSFAGSAAPAPAVRSAAISATSVSRLSFSRRSHSADGSPRGGASAPRPVRRARSRLTRAAACCASSERSASSRALAYRSCSTASSRAASSAKSPAASTRAIAPATRPFLTQRSRPDEKGIGPNCSPFLCRRALSRLALFDNRDKVAQHDIELAFQEQAMGLENPVEEMEEDQRRQIAYHEAGHAIVQYYLRPDERIVRVSIVRRSEALGYVLPVPNYDFYSLPLRTFVADILVSMAGHVATKLFLGEYWTGATGDFQNVRPRLWQLAHYGYFGPPLDMSQGMNMAKDKGEVVEKFWNRLEMQTETILLVHATEVHAVAQALLERNDMTGKQCIEVIRAAAGEFLLELRDKSLRALRVELLESAARSRADRPGHHGHGKHHHRGEGNQQSSARPVRR